MRAAIVRIAVAAALLSGSALAQDAWVSMPTYRPSKTLFILNWEVASPIGSFNDYTDEFSFRGGSFESRSFLKDNFTLGASFSWNRFSQTFDNVQVPITNGTASGPVFRSASFFGVRGLAHYYFGAREAPLRPYLGVGIGGLWNYSYQQVTDLALEQDNFNFVVDPELGLLYWFASGGTNAGLNLAFRYTYTTATTGRESDAQTLSGIIGFAFGY